MLSKLVSMASLANAVELTPDNWDSETAGKVVFIKFQAPWCGHCKKMKPDWDKLMEEFDGDENKLIGDVDCTGSGKALCGPNGVRGYPTIKHGDPSALEDYKGGRSYDELKKFADELKPGCSPSNIDVCDEAGKKKIEELQALSKAKLAKMIQEYDTKQKEATQTFDAEVAKLNKKYEELVKAKDTALNEVKEATEGYGGLSMMKMVKAHADKEGASDDEL